MNKKQSFLSKGEKILLFQILEDFRYEQCCEEYDLSFDYKEFYSSTLEQIFKVK